MAEIAWTEEAQRWLKDIFEYIAADNPRAAVRTVQGIWERAQVLATFPEIGHRHLASKRNIRILLYGHYRIGYLVKDDGSIEGAAVFEISNRNLPVPIVYTISADPVSAGFATTLARPRGNMTGLSLMAVEFNGKRLEILQEIVPTLRRVGIIGNPEHPGAHLERAFSEETGKRLGLSIEYLPTRNLDELVAILNTMARNPPPAISVLADGFAVQNRHRIIDFAMKSRVPVISGWPVFAQSGALCTYGPLLAESYRRLAYYVDRVLRGAKPADLPIEQPSKFELVVNLKTAKMLGLVIPPAVLARADRVLE